MAPGMWQILIVALLALLLFGGRGKISAIMGDFAKGITSFRKGLREDADENADAEAMEAPSIETEKREDEKTGS